MVWYRKGNVKPEEEWPTDEYWRAHWSNLHGSEEEPDPGHLVTQVTRRSLDPAWKRN